MKTSEAEALIRVVLDSIRSNPHQFNFNVTVKPVGAMGIGGAGGPGIVGIANGGGIGFQVSSSPSQVQIQIAHEQAEQAISKQADIVFQTLESILQELRSQTMSAEKSVSFIAQLKSTWIPNVLISLIGTILQASIS
ncbi:hypothetical protein [Aeromonas hydrophila]|uniref:hypothetical protein n=1 Tax=Aeromonas hydrophila TaxID=644 RepID=UPI00321651BC